jgi:hypothetical protein
MALHDYVCDHCGRYFPDVDVPIAIGATRGAPDCPDCVAPTSWIPQIGAMDAREPFQTFTTRDGKNREVVVDSLRTLRRIERESEALARNGEGQQIVFRRWAQDGSNIGVNTLGDPAAFQQRPDPAAVKKFGKALRSAVEPDVTFGPGVSEANASALPAAGGGGGEA